MTFLVISAAVLLGLYMAWSIGANDAANSMADAVGSKSISIKHAVILAGICEFAGAVLVGSHVTDTVRKGIVSPDALAARPEVLVLGMACALLAAAVWLHAATWMGMPVSTTHSIVGAVAGFGIVAAGWSAVQWGTMGRIVASWFISPVAGAVLAFILFRVISRTILGSDTPARAAVRFMPPVVFYVIVVVTLATLYKGLKHVSGQMPWLTDGRAVGVAVMLGLCGALISRKWLGSRLRGLNLASLGEQLERVERAFAPLVVLTSCTIAFAHGANDVANAIGPLAAIVDIVRTGVVTMQVQVPLWVLALGGVGIVAGLASFGYRVMHTVGTKLTQLTPSRGVAADVAACTMVLLCTRLGLPVSTTHVLVGAIIGVGLARGLGAVNRRVMRNIFGSWFVTVPAAAVLAIIFFLLGKLLVLDAIAAAMAPAAGGPPV